MFKKTTLAALIGVAAGMLAVPAQAFTISSGDYKMTVDGYVNGTIYPFGFALPLCGSVAACDGAALAPAVGGVGSEDSWGILSISSITNTTTNTTMFSRGVDGYLIGTVAGITDFTVVSLGTSKDYAQGGTINIYQSATDYTPGAPASTNQAAVFAAIAGANPLYLSLNFVAGAGNPGADFFAPAAAVAATYISTFDPSTLTGAGSGFLEVTGGSAAGHFDTNTKTTWAGLNADASFSVTLSPISPSDAGLFNWLAGSSSDVKGHAIPEPGSMALAGLGLLGLAALRRRKLQA